MPAPDERGIFAALDSGSALSDRVLDAFRGSTALTPRPFGLVRDEDELAADEMAVDPARFDAMYRHVLGDAAWCRDFVNRTIAASVSGPMFAAPANRPTEAERTRRYAESRFCLSPGEPVACLDLSGYRAGDLLRAIAGHAGTVTIEGTGTEADGTWALEQFEGGTSALTGTARLRRIDR